MPTLLTPDPHSWLSTVQPTGPSLAYAKWTHHPSHLHCTSIPPAVSLISAEDIANFSSTKARHGTICNCPPLPHKPLVIKAHQSDLMCPILLLLTFPVLTQVLYSFVGLLQLSPNFNNSTPIYGRYDFYSESSQLGRINFHSELYVALEPSFPVMVGRVKLVTLN